MPTPATTTYKICLMLQKMRHERNIQLTITEWANQAGVSRNTLGGLLHLNATNVTVQTLNAVLDVVGLDLEQFFTLYSER